MVKSSGTFTFLAALAAVALLASCASAPPSTPAPESPPAKQPEQVASAGTTAKPPEVAPAPAVSAEVAALQQHLDTALDKLDQGAVGEGILSLVTILSDVSRSPSASDDARQYQKRAEEELKRIGDSLSLSAGVEWMDQDKNQIAGSTLDIGTPKALNPSVTLTYSDRGAKSVVGGAPVVFEFVKGSGTLVTPVSTNEYGQANTTVTALDNPKAETILRASVSYRVRGFTYSFSGATRDFAYVPPVRKATILVLERGTFEDGSVYVSTEPVILDRAFNVLKRIDFEYSPYNGKLLGDTYMKVFGGENAAIRAMGLEEGVSYLVMVLSDAYYVKQVELNGRKYELYKSKTNATTRLIRASDGAILYSGTVQSVDGQGNTAEKAVIDGFRNAAEKMAEKLDADLKEITKSLTG